MMATATDLLLAQAQNCLSELIDSAFLDDKDMGGDCLESFDCYDWQPKSTLNELQAKQWSELLQKGINGDMDGAELTEFLGLTSADGQTHPYFYCIQARQLVNSTPEDADDDNSVSCPMVDWRVESNKHLAPADREAVPAEYNKQYSASIKPGNQIGIEINDEDGEPSLGLLIEINHGTPALHIDLDGGGNVLHLHKGQGGLVITPDSQFVRFAQAEDDELSYHDANSLLVRT